MNPQAFQQGFLETFEKFADFDMRRFLKYDVPKGMFYGREAARSGNLLWQLINRKPQFTVEDPRASNPPRRSPFWEVG